MRCICLFSSSLDICQIKPWQSEQIFLNIAFLHVSKHCAFNCCENTKSSKTEKKENEKVQETGTFCFLKCLGHDEHMTTCTCM